MIIFQEKAISRAIEQVVAHPEPFSAEELQAVPRLIIWHASHLAELSHCVNLQELEIYASDITDIAFVATLEALDVLKLYAVPLADIQALATCRHLKQVNLAFTYVRELAPLRDLPELQQGIVIGNPLSDACYHECLPQLLNASDHAETHRMLLGPDEESWKCTRRLHDKYTLPLCYGKLEGVRGVTVRPGIPKYTQGNVDFVTDDEFDIADLLFDLSFRSDDDREELLQKTFGVALEKNPGVRQLNFTPQREIGNQQQALAWIDAADLPAAITSALRHFVEHFPTLTYSREPADAIERDARKAGVTLPPQFVNMRQTLTSVEPHRDALIRFDPETEQKHWEGSAVWFRLSVTDMSRYDRERLAAQNAKILPYGFATSEHRDLTLAINVSGAKDTRVYAYFPENLDSPELGPPYISKAVNTLFISYVELFEHIAEVKIKEADREIIIPSAQ